MFCFAIIYLSTPKLQEKEVISTFNLHALDIHSFLSLLLREKESLGQTPGAELGGGAAGVAGRRAARPWVSLRRTPQSALRPTKVTLETHSVTTNF